MFSAADNIDGTVPAYAVVANPSNTFLRNTTINTKNLGKYSVEFFASDKAGAFGLHGACANTINLAVSLGNRWSLCYLTHCWIGIFQVATMLPPKKSK
jgi:hypothetical protein